MEKHFCLGLTVVNLIVVIVIIGTLSFILFHKIFSVDVQVAAMEINPQAGKWNTLQVAYALEYEKLGSFREIGYTPFGKVAEDGESSSSDVFDYSSDLQNGKGRFLAVNKINLNDCKKYEGIWLAYGNPEQVIGNAVVNLPIKRCAVLTPSFELLVREP